MRNTLATSVLLALFVSSSFGLNQIVPVPNTTLAAQLANNTSAANSFATQSNGNMGATNVSKIDIRTLLYPGATTKIYAHLMLWFGGTNHMNVGYSSTSPAQVHKQIVDMISRGISGVMIDWYGPGNLEDQATKLVMAEAEKHPGFSFAIVIDKGAIKNGCSGCTAQQVLVNELNYIAQTYFPSPAYMRLNGRPLVTNFDIDLHYTIDWTALAGIIPGSPVYIFGNSPGFTHNMTSGSYGWGPSSSSYGQPYLSTFYTTGQAHPSLHTFGSVFKGFNDTLASWTKNRISGQQCGQTWLNTFAKIRSLYNSTRPLDAVQLVTWNDYEEGTEIESGIDNCLSVSASVSGTALNWTISGNENTLDHYSIYISLDGKNLMRLTDVATGNRSLNLGSYNLATGSYKVFVQAVGKPSLRNHMSRAVTYAANGSGLAVAAAPSSLSLTPGQSGKLQITVSSSDAASAPVSLSCSQLPVGTSCVFSPASVLPGRTAGLTITTSHTQAANLAPGLVYALSMPGFGLVGLVLTGSRKQRMRVLLGALLLVCVLLCSCGGVGASNASAKSGQLPTPAGTFSFMVNAVSGSSRNSVPVTLRII